VGVYTMAGSIGAAAGPVVLGIVAQWFGLRMVFVVAAGLVLAAAFVLRVLSRTERMTLPTDAQPSTHRIS
jgi:MFS family permease